MVLAKSLPPSSPNSPADSGRVFSIHSPNSPNIEGADEVSKVGHSQRWRRVVRHQKVRDKYAPRLGGSGVLGGASDTGASSKHRGFDVAAAIKKTHGVTIRQFRKRLDNPAGYLEASSFQL